MCNLEKTKNVGGLGSQLSSRVANLSESWYSQCPRLRYGYVSRQPSFRGYFRIAVREYQESCRMLSGDKVTPILWNAQMFCYLFMDSYQFLMFKGFNFIVILCEFFDHSTPVHHPFPPHRREGCFVLAIWCQMFHFNIIMQGQAVRWWWFSCSSW